MDVRYPRPLLPGDTIGVTAPSSGVADRHRARLDVCVRLLEDRGYRVVVGACMSGDGVTSAPAAERAAELTGMLTDGTVRAVVPPWGGELAVDLLDRVDWSAVRAAEPTWFVGYSDISTLLTPMTLLTGVATVHGPNLVDTPYAPPEGMLGWLDVVTAAPGSTLAQQSPGRHIESWPDIAADPGADTWPLTAHGRWRRLSGEGPVTATGRLVGGCLETVSMLPGTPYGDVGAFATAYAPEGLLVYLEVAETDAMTVARMLHSLRLAGWFERAAAVLLGRTAAPSAHGWSQLDAVRDALGELPCPVLVDVDTGHVPPQMPLVNGALATVELDSERATLTQQLV